jgi:CcmD family protein
MSPSTRTLRQAAASVRTALAASFAWLLSAGAALAQDAAEDRSQAFRAVEGAVKEDVPGGPLLVAAYAIMWVFVLLYVVRLVRLQQRAERDVQRLEQVLSREAPRGGAE